MNSYSYSNGSCNTVLFITEKRNLLISQPMSSNLCCSTVNCIKSLSISVKIKGYFEEIFDYGSQFSFSPENIRNEGLAAGYSKNLISLNRIAKKISKTLWNAYFD